MIQHPYNNQETAGSMMGNKEWESSGQQEKEQARHDMQQASKDRDPARDGFGKSEELAGKITGCEGMKEEGAVSGA
jgi:uncharacterized protein YjbJ (UPF0337 family)